MSRTDLKTILAILILSCLLALSACSTFLPPTLEQKSAPEIVGDTPTFPLKSLDTPTSLPTLTPTTPPEEQAAAEGQAGAYPEPGAEAVVVEEAVVAEEATEAVAVEATEAVVEETEAVTEEPAVEATEAVDEEAAASTEEPAAAESTPEPPESTESADASAETSETDSAGASSSETDTAKSAAPVSLAEPLPSADLELPQKYTLQNGEFPYCIARRYNVNPVELMRLNYLYYNQIFRKGLILWMPQSGKAFPGERALNPHTDVYTVQKDGETIYTAACYYGDIDPAALATANGLALDAILAKGQQIFAAP